MWGLTFLAALLTLLLRNTPSSHGKGRHAGAAAEPLFDAPKPFSKPYSVVSLVLVTVLLRTRQLHRWLVTSAQLCMSRGTSQRDAALFREQHKA